MFLMINHTPSLNMLLAFSALADLAKAGRLKRGDGGRSMVSAPDIAGIQPEYGKKDTASMTSRPSRLKDEFGEIPKDRYGARFVSRGEYNRRCRR